MNKLLDRLNNNKMCLIASIPENNYDIAKAAWEAGADAVKVHINVWHRASNNTFGTLEDNFEVFSKILKDCPVPVGIVVGEDAFVAEDNVDKAIEMGFDFISLYGHHTPASLAYRKDITNFFAVNSTYTLDEINAVSNSSFADILEMSICLPETYGERLNAKDLVRYEYISKHSAIPTVVPTQHNVLPTDVKALYKCGVKAVMVGAISMGKEIETISKTLKEFRKEIDKL